RKPSISVLVACAGACGLIALRLDRPADRRPPVSTSPVVGETPAEIPAIAERSAKKGGLIDRLIAGDLRLADAAEAVIGLNRDWPLLPPELYEVYPGGSLRERVAHMLVGAVEFRLAADDPRRGEILGRLATELRDIVAAGDGAGSN